MPINRPAVKLSGTRAVAAAVAAAAEARAQAAAGDNNQPTQQASGRRSSGDSQVVGTNGASAANQGTRGWTVRRLGDANAVANPSSDQDNMVLNRGQGFRPGREPIHQAMDGTGNGAAGDGNVSQQGSQPEASSDQAQQAAGQPRVLRDESNFIQNVGQFYNTQDMSDVILKIGEEKFYGHKFVLAKSSEVFRTMLYSDSWKQKSNGSSSDQSSLPEIELEETEECRKYFDTFLKFLYTAEVSISVESAVGILCLADKYSVTSLKCLCTQYMVEHTRSPLVQNALQWYSWSKALHMDELIEQCSRTIAWNAETLLDSPEWRNMDADFVNDLLRNSDLVIPREEMLFNGLMLWLDCEEHAADYIQHANNLLPLIRFPQMQVRELYAVEQSELYQNEEIRPLLEKLINKAYRFRSLCPQQSDIDVSFTEDFYLPRNYLDLTVDTVRMQNTLRFGIQVDVRTYVGPVPSMLRDGEWKITYRKSNDTWTLQIYCHESALVSGEARVQAALIITSQEGSVVQVEESDVTVCSRGNHLTMGVTVPSCGQEIFKSMAVLMKPLPK